MVQPRMPGLPSLSDINFCSVRHEASHGLLSLEHLATPWAGRSLGIKQLDERYHLVRLRSEKRGNKKDENYVDEPWCKHLMFSDGFASPFHDIWTSSVFQDSCALSILAAKRPLKRPPGTKKRHSLRSESQRVSWLHEHKVFFELDESKV